jgi:hypothetical protein
MLEIGRGAQPVDADVALIVLGQDAARVGARRDEPVAVRRSSSRRCSSTAMGTTPLALDGRACVGSLAVAALTEMERRALAIVVDLDRRRSAVIVAHVAGELGHAATAANRILRALERRGLVVREVDHNQNAEVIFATRAGRDALDA